MSEATSAPVVPPGWVGAEERLIRIADPSGNAVAWLVGDSGANCIAYAVRRDNGWVQILDPGSSDALAERPTRFGCPILFPFPGHVVGMRYRWSGVEHVLPPTGPGPSDYAHGFAPRLPWRIERTMADGVECELLTTRDIPGGADAAGYPFVVRLRLSVRLVEQALTITLTATNEGDQPAPVGLGLHPYFDIGALGGDRAAVRVDIPGRFEHILDDRIPTGKRRAVETPEVRLPPLGETLLVPRTDLRPNPVAILRGGDGGMQVRLSCIEGVRDLLLFAPPTEDSVSVEPLSTAPGSGSQPEGHPDGMVGLEPGATRRLAVTIAVS
jgi:galactose mutarotase-like enzyme